MPDAKYDVSSDIGSSSYEEPSSSSSEPSSSVEPSSSSSESSSSIEPASSSIEPSSSSEISSSSESSSSSKTQEELYHIALLGGEYFLTGLDESLYDQEVIWIPNTVNGHTISGLRSNAFKDMTNLKVVILPSSIDTLGSNVFSGCSSLERIYLRNTTAPGMVENGLLNGANPDVKIYILESAVKSYTTGYTWMNFITKFVTFVTADLKPYR